MKINIGFVVQATSGIGGGDRKFGIYYSHLSEKFFNKSQVVITGNKNQTNNENFIKEENLGYWIEKNKIDAVYLAAKIDDKTFSAIKKKTWIIKNVNFTEVYSKDPKIINLIISKTDYWKLNWLHNGLQNSHVVYNPIDVDKWLLWKEKNNGKYRREFKGKKFIVGRLGRAEPTKWNFLIIKTLWRLDNKRNYDFGFLFAGMPLLYRKILNFTLSKKMKKCVIFLPELRSDEDLAKFYNSIDVFWQTSYIGESFGNVIAESFCFGVPVFTDYKDFFKKSGKINKKWYNAQSELVDGNINGAYCNYPEIVEKFLNETTLAKLRKMGLNGQKKSKNVYDAKLAGQTIAKVLYGYLKKDKKTKDALFESINQVPSDKEVKDWAKKYQKRLEEEKKQNEIPLLRHISYKIQEKLWNAIEFIYVGVRFLLRKVKIDIEGK